MALSTSLTKRACGRLLLAAALFVGVAAGPAVAHADPDPTTVAATKAKLDQMAAQSSELTEKYDVAQSVVDAKQAAATTAEQAAAAAAAKFAQARQLLAQVVRAQYESPAYSTTGALLTSTSGQSYLDAVSNLNLISTNRTQLVEDFEQASAASTTATKAAATALAVAKKTRDQLNSQRATLTASITKYQTLLSTLSAADQASYRSTNTVADTQAQVPVAQAVISSAPPPSNAASVAVAFALAQVGKPYVFGSGGPNSYDCSGLTSAAYRAAGISLPHSAAGQYGYGTHVAFGDLQPGDLIFLYHPISHVEIYIGNGLAVSAPTSGENVKVITISAGGDYTGATRLTS